MPIKERRKREKQEMRERILAAAQKLFVAKGFEKTSIRNIAETIEYSPATIYLYFADKNAIFFELHNRIFKKFLAQFEAVANADVASPMERLHLLGRKYIEFGLNNPEYYELMFIMSTPMEHLEKVEETEGWQAGLNSHAHLEKIVAACMDAGYLQGKSVRETALAMWAIVHGLVSLAIKSRLDKMYPEQEIPTLIYAAYENLLENIET